MPKIAAATVREHHDMVKNKLIEATERILSEEGPQGLSAGAVAKEAGIARNSIYRYVDSVDDLKMLALRSFVPRWHQTIFSQVNPEDDPADRLVAFALASLRETRNRSHSSLMSMMRMSTGRPGKSAERADTKGNVASVHEMVDGFLASQFAQMGAESPQLWGVFARALIFEAFKQTESEDEDGAQFEAVAAQLEVAISALAERVRTVARGEVPAGSDAFMADHMAKYRGGFAESE